MANKMLIDASHPEETRVVVLRGNRVEEFDFESANKKPLRGNIYLAKVTRVEPSLQAAFVDYGGNRHGFLAFSEIHPDYYQIPVSDRQALLDEDALAHGQDEEDEAQPPQRRSRRHRRGRANAHAEKRHASDDESITDSRDAELEEAGPERTGAAQNAEAGDASEGAAAVAAQDIAAEPAVDTEDAATPEQPVLPLEPAPAGAGAQTTAEAPQSAQTHVEEPPAGLAETADEQVSANAEAGESAPHDPDRALATQGASTEDAGADEKGEAGNAPAETAHEGHRLATDPEGFAVVEDQDEVTEADEAAAAAREDELEARLRPEVPSEDEDDEETDQVEQIGGDAMEEVPLRSYRARRQYKIQEVIKRRQVLLVQVVKEERGTKGAALTTYLSLAGRYSVLMPNTARGGGISRKITDAGDRQRLKAIAQDLEVPEGMGVILRTAGASRTKAEVKRDFEYLLRMWETVREMTLKSTAPTLVYEEGSLVKRAIRDLYNKDIDEVTVSGDAPYREAKEFMRMLMPSHAKNVQPYRDAQPIFTKYGVEAQLDAMFSNHVPLKSGGYLVINQTEALVAIDVNSGRATREHNIEDTALRTNVEAADEVARQLRLRDLAGLIVVDFIDMEESRNNRAVERRMKEALKNDRARIQIGRISHFGLLEMSRQRIRTGVLEGSTTVCPHCAGAGTVRSTASIALHVLRVLEDALIKSSAHNIIMRTRTEVALYILNQKRANLSDLEQRFGVSITIVADDSLTGTAYHTLERGEPAAGVAEPVRPETAAETREDEAFIEDMAEAEESETQSEDADQSDASRRRRRRRRRRGREREATISANAPQPSDAALAFVAQIGRLPEPRAEGAPSEDGAAGEEAGAALRAEGEPKRDGRRRRPRRREHEPNEPTDEAISQAATEVVAELDVQVIESSAEESTAEEPTAEEPTAEEPAAEALLAAWPVAAEADEHTTESADHQAPTELVEVPIAEVEAQALKPVATMPALHLEPSDAKSEAKPAQDAADESHTERSVQPLSPAELDRPKRTGWWRRAKTSQHG